MATALRLIEHDELGLPPEQRHRLDAAEQRIRTLAMSAVENAVEIGRELAAVNAVLAPLRGFAPWLERKFGMSRATAYNYIVLFERSERGECLTVGQSGRLRLRDLYRISGPADDDVSPHDGDDPEPRLRREDVRQALIDSLRRELEAVRDLAEDARMVAAMLGDAWSHLVGQARALDRSRNAQAQTARAKIAASAALDEVQRRRLLLLDDPTLEKLARAWAMPFTTSARVFSEMAGEDVSFDQVRYFQKVHEALNRG